MRVVHRPGAEGRVYRGKLFARARAALSFRSPRLSLLRDGDSSLFRADDAQRIGRFVAKRARVRSLSESARQRSHGNRTDENRARVWRDVRPRVSIIRQARRKLRSNAESRFRDRTRGAIIFALLICSLVK